jgi:hypothetical protein
MKATIEFQLPEEHDEHVRAVHAHNAWVALYDIDQHLRSVLKHGHDYKSVQELAEHIRREINEALSLVQ